MGDMNTYANNTMRNVPEGVDQRDIREALEKHRNGEFGEVGLRYRIAERFQNTTTCQSTEIERERSSG